jgi:hypothetical protein
VLPLVVVASVKFIPKVQGVWVDVNEAVGEGEFVSEYVITGIEHPPAWLVVQE